MLTIMGGEGGRGVAHIHPEQAQAISQRTYTNHDLCWGSRPGIMDRAATGR